MEQQATLTIESDWLPAPELDRLVAECRADTPALLVSTGEGPEHRGLDPAVAVALISGIFGLLVPFAAKLAERVFAHEPDASVTLETGTGKNRVVLQASLPAQQRDRLLREAMSSGATRVRISLGQPSRRG